jgi:outer membrane immunogenic protein
MSASAHAADLRGGSLKDAPVYAAPAIWSGLYVGGSVGFGVGDTTGALKFEDGDYVEELRDGGGDEFGDFLSALFSSDYDVNGAIYGVHLGYNFQREGGLVYGVELGLNGTDINGSDSCAFIFTCERELDWYATAVGRIGYAAGNTLFYGFGGLAWGEVKTDISFVGFPLLNGEETHLGWTAGVGIEHAFTERFSARVEYSHVDLGEEDHSLGDGGLASEVDFKFDAIKIGASYKLTGGYEGLEASK